jgi:hypothetical protein
MAANDVPKIKHTGKMDFIDGIVTAEGVALPLSSSAPAAKKTGRGKSWKEAENTILARSVGAVGFDAIHGADQAAETYWKRIHEAFCSRGGSPERSVKSLRNRWSLIQASINVFIGFYSTATSIDRSGYTPDDYVKFAMDLFHQDQKKEFEFLSCWQSLQQFGDKWKVCKNCTKCCREAH